VREDIAKAVEWVERAEPVWMTGEASAHAATVSIAYSLIAIAALLEDVNDTIDRGPA
jgi:hypothetical protein